VQNKDYINVYWSPQSTPDISHVGEWNMLYPEPTILFNELLERRMRDAGVDTYFSCPATNDKFKKTYVFKNALPSSYEFDFTEGKKYFTHTSNTYVNYDVLRNPTISDGPLVNLNLYYSFFSDEPLEGVFTPPMLHKPQYTQYGTCVPGQFDIGRWFRPYPLEVQMWDKKGVFHLEDEEPIFYLELKTKKKINLIRYKMNGTISHYLASCSNSKKVWGAGVSLEKRYDRFMKSKMREMILTEIKKNVLDTE
jgi:hypothetical protein